MTTFLPMLAETAEPRQITSGLFLTDRWLFQPKVDGERRIVLCDGAGGVRALNRDGLTVLVHPNTGRDRDDHTLHATWMGAVLPLDVSVLKEEGE